jgi:methylmalonyl-CoA mutase N-terminal domain/subunit
MRMLLADIPLDTASMSMTINSTGAILLLLYQLVAEEQGVPSTAISGTIQNDILKEYIARGTYVYPPRPSMRIITDSFEYCAAEVPSGTRSRSPATTSARPAARPCRRSLSRSPTASPTSKQRSPPGSTSTTSPPRLSFFLERAQQLLRGDRKFPCVAPDSGTA